MKESKFHKKFDDEYKREIVRLVEELGRSPKQVAEDIGVTPQTVRTWVKKFGKSSSDAFPGKGKLHPADEELRQMKKKIKDLELGLYSKRPEWTQPKNLDALFIGISEI